MPLSPEGEFRIEFSATATATVAAGGAGLLSYRPARLVIPPSAARPKLGWFSAFLPPLVAIACWPTFFVIFFVMSFTLALMAVTACLVWAWRVSGRLAAWRYWRRVRAVADGAGIDPGSGYRGRLHALIFAAQAVAILSSCPIFWLAINFARQHGVAPQGWWVGHRLL